MASLVIQGRQKRHKMRYISENDDDMVVKSLSVPPGLEALMEGLTKEVLRIQPQDICLFASEHFAKLCKMRDSAGEEYKFCKTTIHEKNKKNIPAARPESRKSHPKDDVEMLDADNSLTVPLLDLGRLSATSLSPEIKFNRSEASTAEIDKIQNGFFHSAANFINVAQVAGRVFVNSPNLTDTTDVTTNKEDISTEQQVHEEKSALISDEANLVEEIEAKILDDETEAIQENNELVSKVIEETEAKVQEHEEANLVEEIEAKILDDETEAIQENNELVSDVIKETEAKVQEHEEANLVEEIEDKILVDETEAIQENNELVSDVIKETEAKVQEHEEANLVEEIEAKILADETEAIQENNELVSEVIKETEAKVQEHEEANPVEEIEDKISVNETEAIHENNELVAEVKETEANIAEEINIDDKILVDETDRQDEYVSDDKETEANIAEDIKEATNIEDKILVDEDKEKLVSDDNETEANIAEEIKEATNIDEKILIEETEKDELHSEDMKDNGTTLVEEPKEETNIDETAEQLEQNELVSEVIEETNAILKKELIDTASEETQIDETKASENPEENEAEVTAVEEGQNEVLKLAIEDSAADLSELLDEVDIKLSTEDESELTTETVIQVPENLEEIGDENISEIELADEKLELTEEIQNETSRVEELAFDIQENNIEKLAELITEDELIKSDDTTDQLDEENDKDDIDDNIEQIAENVITAESIIDKLEENVLGTDNAVETPEIINTEVKVEEELSENLDEIKENEEHGRKKRSIDDEDFSKLPIPKISTTNATPTPSEEEHDSVDHSIKGPTLLGVPAEEAYDEAKLNKSALLIQSIWRGYNIRKFNKSLKILEEKDNDEIEKENIAATLIQSLWRGHNTRKQNLIPQIAAKEEIRDVAIEEIIAAIKLQSIWRGFAARKVMKSNAPTSQTPVDNAEKEGSTIEEIIAATKLQSVWRGFATRKGIKTQISKIEESQNEKVAHEINTIEEIMAATKLQSVWRGFNTRKAMKSKVPKIEETDNKINTIEEIMAAIKLQSVWRGFNIRKAMKTNTAESKPEISSEETKLDDVMKEINAAIRIQSIWRGFKARKLQNLDGKNSENEKQTLANIVDGSKKEILAATLIQSLWRGHLIRKDKNINDSSKFVNEEIMKQAIAATLIQSLWRGHTIRKNKKIEEIDHENIPVMEEIVKETAVHLENVPESLGLEPEIVEKNKETLDEVDKEDKPDLEAVLTESTDASPDVILDINEEQTGEIEPQTLVEKNKDIDNQAANENIDTVDAAEEIKEVIEHVEEETAIVETIEKDGREILDTVYGTTNDGEEDVALKEDKEQLTEVADEIITQIEDALNDATNEDKEELNEGEIITSTFDIVNNDLTKLEVAEHEVPVIDAITNLEEETDTSIDTAENKLIGTMEQGEKHDLIKEVELEDLEKQIITEESEEQSKADIEADVLNILETKLEEDKSTEEKLTEQGINKEQVTIDNVEDQEETILKQTIAATKLQSAWRGYNYRNTNKVDQSEESQAEINEDKEKVSENITENLNILASVLENTDNPELASEHQQLEDVSVVNITEPINQNLNIKTEEIEHQFSTIEDNEPTKENDIKSIENQEDSKSTEDKENCENQEESSKVEDTSETDNNITDTQNESSIKNGIHTESKNSSEIQEIQTEETSETLNNITDTKNVSCIKDLVNTESQDTSINTPINDETTGTKVESEENLNSNEGKDKTETNLKESQDQSEASVHENDNENTELRNIKDAFEESEASTIDIKDIEDFTQSIDSIDQHEDSKILDESFDQISNMKQTPLRRMSSNLELLVHEANETLNESSIKVNEKLKDLDASLDTLSEEKVTFFIGPNKEAIIAVSTDSDELADNEEGNTQLVDDVKLNSEGDTNTNIISNKTEDEDNNEDTLGNLTDAIDNQVKISSEEAETTDINNDKEEKSNNIKDVSEETTDELNNILKEENENPIIDKVNEELDEVEALNLRLQNLSRTNIYRSETPEEESKTKIEETDNTLIDSKEDTIANFDKEQDEVTGKDTSSVHGENDNTIPGTVQTDTTNNTKDTHTSPEDNNELGKNIESFDKALLEVTEPIILRSYVDKVIIDKNEETKDDGQSHESSSSKDEIVEHLEKEEPNSLTVEPPITIKEKDNSDVNDDSMVEEKQENDEINKVVETTVEDVEPNIEENNDQHLTKVGHEEEIEISADNSVQPEDSAEAKEEHDDNENIKKDCKNDVQIQSDSEKQSEVPDNMIVEKTNNIVNNEDHKEQTVSENEPIIVEEATTEDDKSGNTENEKPNEHIKEESEHLESSSKEDNKGETILENESTTVEAATPEDKSGNIENEKPNEHIKEECEYLEPSSNDNNKEETIIEKESITVEAATPDDKTGNIKDEKPHEYIKEESEHLDPSLKATDESTIENINNEIHNQAAVKIQSAWRGHNTRKTIEDQKELEELQKPAECDETSDENDIITKAATTIQAGARGYLVRKRRNAPTFTPQENSSLTIDESADNISVASMVTVIEKPIVAKSPETPIEENQNKQSTEAAGTEENNNTNEDDLVVATDTKATSIQPENEDNSNGKVSEQTENNNTEEKHSDTKEETSAELDEMEALNLRLQNLSRSNVYRSDSPNEETMHSNTSSKNNTPTHKIKSSFEEPIVNEPIHAGEDNQNEDTKKEHINVLTQPEASENPVVSNEPRRSVNFDEIDIDSSKYDLKVDQHSPRSKNASPVHELSTAALKISAAITGEDDSIADALEEKDEKKEAVEEKAVEYIHIPLQGPIPEVTQSKMKAVKENKPDTDSPDYIYIPLKDPGTIEEIETKSSNDVRENVQEIQSEDTSLPVTNTDHLKEGSIDDPSTTIEENTEIPPAEDTDVSKEEIQDVSNREIIESQEAESKSEDPIIADTAVEDTLKNIIPTNSETPLKEDTPEEDLIEETKEKPNGSAKSPRTKSSIDDIDAFLERNKQRTITRQENVESSGRRPLFDEIDSIIESYGQKRQMSPTSSSTDNTTDLAPPKIADESTSGQGHQLFDDLATVPNVIIPPHNSDAAATKIQSAFRGFRTRQQMKNNKNVRTDIDLNKQENSTERRNSLGSDKTYTVARSPTNISTPEDVSSDEETVKNLAASKIQKTYRNYRNKQNSLDFENLKNEAASKIQESYKNYRHRRSLSLTPLGRENFPNIHQVPQLKISDLEDKFLDYPSGSPRHTTHEELKDISEISNCAATKIQSTYRGFKARQGLQNNNESDLDTIPEIGSPIGSDTARNTTVEDANEEVSTIQKKTNGQATKINTDSGRHYSSYENETNHFSVKSGRYDSDGDGVHSRLVSDEATDEEIGKDSATTTTSGIRSESSIYDDDESESSDAKSSADVRGRHQVAQGYDGDAENRSGDGNAEKPGLQHSGEMHDSVDIFLSSEELSQGAEVLTSREPKTDDRGDDSAGGRSITVRET